PGSHGVGYPVKPAHPNAQSETSDVQAAGGVLGLHLHVENASSESAIDAAFARFGQQRVDALFVAADGFFVTRRDQLITLAARHALPTSFGSRDSAVAGALMSYGPRTTDAYRQAGVYTGRILKG